MNTYTDEVKAQVIAKILLGHSVSQIAKDHNIPLGTVSGWKTRAIQSANNADLVEQKKENDEDIKLRIGSKLLIYLEANIDAAIAQLKIFSDPNWIQQQSAHEMAILHGVMSDKSVRMIQAFKQRDD